MTVGTTYEVTEAFAAGEGSVTRTASAGVPGGCRVSIEGDTFYSYRTAQAVRLNSIQVAVTTRKYSVTTGGHVSALVAALYRAGYRPIPSPEGDPQTIHAAVPGRWGGYGPAWHPTGWEDVPAVIYEDSDEARRAYSVRIAAEDAARAERAARKAARIADQIGAGL